MQPVIHFIDPSQKQELLYRFQPKISFFISFWMNDRTRLCRLGLIGNAVKFSHISFIQIHLRSIQMWLKYHWAALPPASTLKLLCGRRADIHVAYSHKSRGQISPHLVWSLALAGYLFASTHTHTPPSLNLQTHTCTQAPQRLMDLSRNSPLSGCNKAFHACSLCLFGTWSIKPMPRCQNLLTRRPRGHSH